MYKNIIFDFGAVLVDWNPHYLFDPYFGSSEKTDWFLANICDMKWNVSVDCGKPMAEAVEERSALYPEWSKEIHMYFEQWIEMMGSVIPGMHGLIKDLKRNGYRIFGLSNWSAETHYQIHDSYPVLSEFEDFIISGDVKLLKPYPEIYKALLDRNSLDPSECIFIDDNPDNVAGGMAVGIDSIRFTDKDALVVELRKRGVTI